MSLTYGTTLGSDGYFTIDDRTGEIKSYKGEIPSRTQQEIDAEVDELLAPILAADHKPKRSERPDRRTLFDDWTPSIEEHDTDVGNTHQS